MRSSGIISAGTEMTAPDLPAMLRIDCCDGNRALATQKSCPSLEIVGAAHIFPGAGECLGVG